MSIDMPDHAKRLAEAWGFVADEELVSGHCSRIFANATAVLKVPFQGEELTYGARAAVKLAEIGGPEILRIDRDSGVILMRRLDPGSDLSQGDLDEDARQAVFVDLSNRMSLLSIEAAMPLRDFLEVDHPLLDRLDKTTEDGRFLHGDLHHYNILADHGTWRPIDPKGLVGDRHYECVAYLRNPLDELNEVYDLRAFTQDRIASLAIELDLDPWRISAWGFLDSSESHRPADHPWRRLHRAYAEILGFS